MKNGPAFQLYAADFLVGTATMTDREVGTYIRLLCYEWEILRLPSEISALCLLTKSTEEVVRRVLQKFVFENGIYTNERLEIERQKQLEWRKKSFLGGVNSGKSRRCTSKGGSTTLPKGGSRVVEGWKREKRKEKTEVKEGGVGEGKNTLTPLSLLWNSTCVNLPQVLEMGSNRKSKESARLQERSLEQWKVVFEKINTSSFCRGESQSGWRATFDWIIRNQDNSSKVLEGKYDSPSQEVVNPYHEATNVHE